MRTKYPILLAFFASLGFFIAGLSNPIMGSKLFLAIDRPDVYLWTSVKGFYQDGEWFIATLLFLFTFLLPITKYLFLGSSLLLKKHNDRIHHWLEIVNKWAMLDVFVLAVIIVNLKFESLIIVTEIRSGTTFFIVSILLLMTTSFLLSRMQKTA
jgi:paraquat-inducible protein A